MNLMGLCASILLLIGTVLYPAPSISEKRSTIVARIRELKGTLEICRAGETRWTFADTTTRIFDSDRLRTAPATRVRLEAPGGLMVYLKENSVVRFESRINPKNDAQLNLITLWSGALYLQTREESDLDAEHRIMTPIAQAAIRCNTGLFVASGKDRPLTDMQVLNGTAAVKNLLFPKTVQLASGKRMEIEKEQELGPTLPVDSTTLSELQWLKLFNKDFLDQEAHKNRIAREQIRAILSTQTTDRGIVVCRFKNLSEYSGLWDIESELASMSMNLLNKSCGIAVSYTNRYPSDSTLDSLKDHTGLVLTGTIHHFDIFKDTRMGADKSIPVNYVGCNLEISYSLISPSDGRTLTAFTRTESAKEKELPLNTFEETVSRPFSFKDTIFRDSSLGKSLAALLNKLNQELRNSLNL